MADLTFPMPEGFTLPEGADKGSFEALATLELEGDGGMLCLKAIDGVPLPSSEKEMASEKDEYAKATNPDTGDFQEAMSMGMSR